MTTGLYIQPEACAEALRYLDTEDADQIPRDVVTTFVLAVLTIFAIGMSHPEWLCEIGPEVQRRVDELRDITRHGVAH